MDSPQKSKWLNRLELYQSKFRTILYNRTIIDVVFVVLLLLLIGDSMDFYFIPYIALIPLLIITGILLLVQMGRYFSVKMNGLLLFLIALYFGLAVIIKEYILPKGLENCASVQSDVIEQVELEKKYEISKVIQDIDSSSGNAIMLAKDKSNGRPVVIKYYSDPNATESIGFACSLTGDVARVFPETLKAGTVNTTRGEALFTVQSIAKGQPIDSWAQENPSSKSKKKCAKEIIERVIQLTSNRFCHRDLHPGNIFVENSGKVSFIDADLAFIETANDKTKFIKGCQRFFFEMPLRLVAFARQNLSEIEQGVLSAWWVHMTTEKYNEYSVDELYMVVCAFIVVKKYGILKTIAKNANNETTWKKVKDYTQASLNTVLPSDVIPTGTPVSSLFYRFLMGGMQSKQISGNLSIDESTQANLQGSYEDFRKTGKIPRFNITDIVSDEFKTTVTVNNRLSIAITIPAGSNIDVKISPGPINEISFSTPLILQSTGIKLNITYIRMDKSSQIDTKYYVEGEGEVIGGAAKFSIQDILGEVVTPDGPLPSGNEVMFLISQISFNETQIKDLLFALNTVNVNVSRLENKGEYSFKVDFEEDNINITDIS